MLFVHKRSTTPINPWPALRHGGANNLASLGVRGDFLVLWNVDIVQREGAWNYLFEFDMRDTLRKGELAQLTGKSTEYPCDMNWKSWLGDDITVITAAVREEILRMPADEAHSNAVITDMRHTPDKKPREVPEHDPEDWFKAEHPREYLIV